jgi:hypothetical protein
MTTRMHRETARFEMAFRSMFATAGSLILTILTILILFFGVFLARSR